MDYIRNRDIIDAGAFIGDSAAVLSQYTDRKIYSYEVSPFNYAKLINTTRKHYIEDKIVPSFLGLSDEKGVMYISQNSVSPANFLKDSGNIPVNITTIDAEVESKHLIPGLIKADTEGCEYQLLMGGINSIRKYRPIFSISIYHNPEGLFEITELIKSLGNYRIEYRAPSLTPDFNKLIIFAYPAEIYPVGPTFEDDE